MKLNELLEAKRMDYAVLRTHKFPDTATGARAYLEQVLNKHFLKLLPKAKVHPDPQVEGVWAADFDDEDKTRVVVYLAGYKEPMGNIRSHNDHEEGTR